ncbi:MAG: Type 1 glutamine amidotransferase-like domain-containing protein [Ignavibacteriaceae bacterium]|nr:Type 1 glutamine amidotransferase-like domain-containing protein [Ignavibacterium sp.]MCC6255232.1 Type 1 glutamine amidotransferase-like domain-containing protein [Ignavibacteriaceae bacterium]HRN26101.1 Type 1 glutamine amidotransferase-like domain-containing protein [Ignavibacteriaceae bacterium]HRP91483.1 Type 1 glutamine amidotransferase-like domain-containing protein [Ignavibacteriaceae bacterium]HRQ53710.1 Type 1 glutamine amidotransferase-like domain-containing protein [Ignavibacteri
MKLIYKIFIATYLFLSVNVSAQGYVCAIGGGSEDYNNWSDAPYSWIVQKSDSGKIIIIDVADATSWLPTYFMSFGADTAYNKTIPSIAVANQQATYDELITAKAIFIRGGDQWEYIRLWKGTKVDSAINFVFQNGGVIAGTSAGAAVLGNVDFSAQNGSAYPDEALRNPFYNRMKFENNFLNLVPNVLFDTHFTERARQGRLIAMIYNQHYNTSVDLIGVGIDDRTAICISPNGTGEVMGSGAVSIFYKDAITNYSAINTGKYTIENLKSHLLTKGWKYDFINNEISFIPTSAKDFDVNRPWFYPQTSFTLTGNNNLTAQLNNLNSFLTENNSNNVLVISHPGFGNSLITITDYLSNNSYNYDVLNITTSNLNDPVEASKINQATCFIFAGDSLNVLSYLNQPVGLVKAAFYNSLAQQIPVIFFGNTGKISGHYFIGNTDTDLYAGYRGKMTINEGLNIFSDLIFQPMIYDNSDFYENRMSAVLWGMMRNRKRIGVYLNGNDRLKINSSSSGNWISGSVQTPYLIVDAQATTKVDSSTYRASGSIGPRQIVAMNDVRFSLTNYSDIKYLLAEGRFDNLTNVDNSLDNSVPNEFVLYQNYPNPFNPTTKIKYTIASVISTEVRKLNVTLKIYDILGKQIAVLIDQEMSPGFYEIEFDGSKFSSGIYFFKLSTSNYSETKPMVLLK